MANCSFTPAGAEVISDDVDGLVVAINLLTGRYFSLSVSASRLWSTLHSAREIVIPDDADPRLAAFLEGLVAEGLATSAETESTDFLDLPASVDLDDLTVTAHSDLQDLLALDPIHDVDPAAGWPQQA